MKASFLAPALVAMLAGVAQAGPLREAVAKHWDAYPLVEFDESIPEIPPVRWGKWHFGNGQWWATSMFQKEAEGPSWTRPDAGFSGIWRNTLTCAWLKAKKSIPSDWKGRRVALEQNGIRGCRVLVFINREKIGEIAAPAGSLDVTHALAYGEENEFHLLLAGKDKNFKLEKDPPTLVVKESVSVDDVFANTSWREKRLTVETTITVPAACRAEVAAEVFDAEGRKVKSVAGAFDLAPGENTVRPFAAWDDPVTWELGRGYLYTLKTSVAIDGKTYSYRDVRFGFREIWREGRRILMNGHEQKFRVTYNHGCNKFGAKFLQGVGYNCIQYAHRTEADPALDSSLLEYLSENGIAAIVPTAAFDWNTKKPLLKPGEKREAFKRIQAMNLRRYRNWPCLAMVYMGVNTYLPQWSYEAKYLGCGDTSEFFEMMKDLVASAKKVNPNVLYFSHSDGSTGEIASANLYFNWVPLQERVEWPSAWADETGKYPFQACEFGHPYQLSWYQDGRDLVTEHLAAYYGEEAYRTEPAAISDRHVESLGIRRILHPLFWRFTDDFVTRLTRAWRTYGVNAGIVWFNLDYGYGMPGWTLEGVHDKYNPCYNFFKSEEEVPKGRPAWAFPSWDIYRKTNLDFLGYLGGARAFTDRRHAYRAGEKVEKQIVLLWDGFDARTFAAKWTATLGGREIASGEVSRELASNIPVFAPVAFDAPPVAEKTCGEIAVTFFDARGEEQSRDRFAFEVYPQASAWPSGTFALWDPAGTTADELKARGADFTRVTSPADAQGGRFLVVGVDALGKGEGAAELVAAARAGRRILVLAQEAAAWQAFGFEVQDRASRVLFLRDTFSPALARLGGDALRDWSGAAGERRVRHAKHEPRWKGTMALAALQLKSPTAVGYLPQIEGEFDMNYAALLDFACGGGAIKFCTLDFFPRGASDAAVEETLRAVFADFLSGGAPAPRRAVVASGEEAKRIAGDTGVAPAQKDAAGAGDLLLAGADSPLAAAEIVAAAERGANVLVVANRKLAKGLALTLSPGPEGGVYCVAFNRANALLRGVGQSQFRWRDRLKASRLSGAGWTIDAEGLLASKTLANGAQIVVTMFNPYAIERGITADRVLVVDGKKRDNPLAMKAAEAGSAKKPSAPGLDSLDGGVAGLELDDADAAAVKMVPDEKKLAACRRRADVSFERSRQLVARLLTNLGAAPAGKQTLYSGLVEPFDPYLFVYW